MKMDHFNKLKPIVQASYFMLANYCFDE